MSYSVVTFQDAWLADRTGDNVGEFGVERISEADMPYQTTFEECPRTDLRALVISCFSDPFCILSSFYGAGV